MNDSFKDHPRSVTEIKADRSQSAKDWTPRDALISTLRDIDQNNLDIDAVIVAYRVRTADGGTQMNYANATPDYCTSLGMLAHVSGRIVKGYG